MRRTSGGAKRRMLGQFGIIHYIAFNHQNNNFLDCDWFKKLLLSTNSLAKNCQVVIRQFVLELFNYPITFIQDGTVQVFARANYICPDLCKRGLSLIT